MTRRQYGKRCGTICYVTQARKPCGDIIAPVAGLATQSRSRNALSISDTGKRKYPGSFNSHNHRPGKIEADTIPSLLLLRKRQLLDTLSRCHILMHPSDLLGRAAAVAIDNAQSSIFHLTNGMVGVRHLTGVEVETVPVLSVGIREDRRNRR